MANNETVKQVCDKSLRNILDTFGKRVCIFDDIADEIEAAHKREMTAKDAEIARLRSLVKEMLSHIEELYQCQSPCDGHCLLQKESCDLRERRDLIAKAKEAAK